MAIAGRQRRVSVPGRPGAVGYVAIIAFLAVSAVVNSIWPLPLWVAGLYLATSALCFVVYAIDKSAATAGRRRVSERSLLLLGVVGGWPGAIIAQQVLRHKTKKVSFRSAFWGSVVVNVVAFVALSSPAFSHLRSGAAPLLPH